MDQVVEVVTNFWGLWLMVIFIAIVAWVYWPGRKKKLEDLGRIPFKDENGET